MTPRLQLNATSISHYAEQHVSVNSGAPAPSGLVTSPQVTEIVIRGAQNGDTSTAHDRKGDRTVAVCNRSYTLVADVGEPLGQRSLGPSGSDTVSASPAGGQGRGFDAAAPVAAPPLTPTAAALHRALASEARIRAGLRRDTKIDLQFTVRGKRGAGRTRETILDRVRFWRKQHTLSIERTRALLASLGGVA